MYIPCIDFCVQYQATGRTGYARCVLHGPELRLAVCGGQRRMGPLSPRSPQMRLQSSAGGYYAGQCSRREDVKCRAETCQVLSILPSSLLGSRGPSARTQTGPSLCGRTRERVVPTLGFRHARRSTWVSSARTWPGARPGRGYGCGARPWRRQGLKPFLSEHAHASLRAKCHPGRPPKASFRRWIALPRTSLRAARLVLSCLALRLPVRPSIAQLRAM